MCVNHEEDLIAPVLTLRARRVLLIAAGAWLLVASLALLVGPWSIGALEGRLDTAAREALVRHDHPWARVSVEGQIVTLIGAAPNDEARLDALAAVQASTWSGGVVAGGVTKVVDATTHARLERGFAFRADASNGQVFIRGDASDAAARDAIDRYADNNFPAGAETDLTLIPGGAATSDWEDAAKRLLGQLARLDRGAIMLDGAQGALIGEAANPQIAESVTGALSSMPAPFSVASIVTPAGGEAEVFIADLAGCDAILGAAQGANALRFDQDGASLSPLSETAIRRIGLGFSACPDALRLELSVRVDDGSEDLAGERAGAVQSLLVQSGVDEAKIDLALVGDQARVISLAVTMDEG
jgi:hypothetical protein